MREYFEFVDDLAKNGEDKIFYNSGPIHASIVMSRIFEYSSSEILIFCGGFNGTVSNNSMYLNSLEDFLKREGTLLKILVEDYEQNKASKIYLVLKKYLKKVSIKETKARIEDTSSKTNVHFAIGDGRMLRIETNPKDYTAEVNFNSDKSNIFIDFFNTINEDQVNTKMIVL